MASLSMAWRVAFLVSVSVALGHAFWLAAEAQSAEISPTWVRVSFDILSLAAWAVLVTTVVKAWRLRGRPASPTESQRASAAHTVFRPGLPWFWELFVWAQGPVLLLSALFLARIMALSTLLTAGLAAFLLLNWLVLIIVMRIHYEVTDEALVVGRTLVPSERIRWSDLQSVHAKAVPFGEHLVLGRAGGRPLRLVTPVEREAFIEALRRHAPDAIMQL